MGNERERGATPLRCSPAHRMAGLLRAGCCEPYQGQRPVSIRGQTEAGARTLLGPLKPTGFGW
jgi:hypothetical protein